MKKIITLILCFASCFAFANPITIPSVEKIFEERFASISEPFYGCIYSIETYEEEDLYTTKIFLESITVGNANQQIEIKRIGEFEDLEEGDANFPKIGDCFAYEPRGNFKIDSWSQATYSGYADLYKNDYKVDNNFDKAVLKDKLTIDEYCQDNISYGTQWLELTGKVKSTEINMFDNFQTVLLSENGDEIIGIVKEQDWKGNERVKEQLRSFQIGEVVSVFGYFAIEYPCNYGWQSIFQILEIIDNNDDVSKETSNDGNLSETSSAEVSSGSITDNPKAIDVPNDSNIKRLYTTVVTDLLTVEISHKGGTIINAYLNDFPNELNSEENFQLLNNTPGSIFHAQSGLIPADQMPTHQSEFTSKRQEYFLQGDSELIVPLVWSGENGVQVIKNYHFKPNSYNIEIDYKVSNNGNKDQILANYSQFAFELSATLNGGLIFTDKGLMDKIHFDEFNTTPKTTSTGGWSAIIHKDFVAAWVPVQNQKITFSTKKSGRNQYLLTTVNPSYKLAAGTTVIIPKNELYIGPIELFGLQ